MHICIYVYLGLLGEAPRPLLGHELQLVLGVEVRVLVDLVRVRVGVRVGVGVGLGLGLGLRLEVGIRVDHVERHGVAFVDLLHRRPAGKK